MQMLRKLIILNICLIVSITTIGQSKLRFDIFKLEDGLPNNQVQCVYQDNRGLIWIGTSQGLSRFDGYSFVNYLSLPNDSLSIKGNLIRVIKEDSKGRLLIGSENGGLNIFDKDTETFYKPLSETEMFAEIEVSVNDIAEDELGNLWLATDFNVVVLDTVGNISLLSDLIPDQEDNFIGNYVRRVEIDYKGNIWLGTNNGVYVYNIKKKSVQQFDIPYENLNHEIWNFYIDTDSSIWIGTYSSGLFTYDIQNDELAKIKLEPAFERTETVRAISKGAFGEYWIGTRGGLYKYEKGKGVTGFYRQSHQEPSGLSNNSILSLFHDDKGDTWVGTRNGLNLLAKSKQVFHRYTAQPGNIEHLNSSIIYAIWIDPDGKIWTGTEDGGINIYDPAIQKYTYLTIDSKPYPISKNCIKAFVDDGKGNLWVATFLGGVDVINMETGVIRNYIHNSNDPTSISDNRVWDLCKDLNGDIWVASSKGIDKFNPKKNSFIHYAHLNGNNSVLWTDADSQGNIWFGSINEVIIYNPSNQKIRKYKEHSRALFEDTQQRIWIGTNNKGIALYSVDEGAIKYFNTHDGLVNNQVLGIQQDNEGYLWMSTSNGLSKFDSENIKFQNFTSEDGLCDNQFCYGATYKTDAGELLFGSVSGFNQFNPSEVVAADTNVPLVFTDLKIFNKSVKINDGENPVLKQSITETKHITLDNKQNFFTLEFAALNFVNSQSNVYTYKLEGFNNDWIEPSKGRTATYTNLNPGDYMLVVKQVFPGNNAESKELKMNITVLPPFWKTNWFFAILMSSIIILVYSIIMFFIYREKTKSQLFIERSNARKLHELDMMKLKFFTNVSHEIRTPLTLIIGPIEKMLNSVVNVNEVKENLKLMLRNAKNLDRLISQLLDFRKIQSGNLKLNLTEADIVGFVKNTVNSFSDYAKEKNITLNFNTLKQRLFVSFDPDKIEKILNNLLSNAFKFTEANGAISVNLSLIFDSEEDDFSEDAEEKQFIEISIKDTGKGISTKNLDRIFFRFFQSDEKDAKAGAGIGLSLVKELINIHKGKIFVTSKLDKGTKFTIRFPFDMNSEVQADKSFEINEQCDIDEESATAIDENETIKSKVMLIVEDNDDVRQFIRSHFKSFYKIHEAADGEEGWKIALETIPDVIISDIIMPKSDGYDLCKRIKNDERTSHIPLLLLTAMHSKESELKGLTTGADDYITKPFDILLLQAKVDNMLSMRDALKDRYTSKMVLEPTNIVLASPDEKFMQRVIAVVEENISNSDLDIENFAQMVGVSRMQLYRKLNALTNMTVKEFIRNIRLKRAAQLLEQQNLNISEIAYEVGFKDLSHFRKCFKREYGMSATEYVATLK